MACATFETELYRLMEWSYWDDDEFNPSDERVRPLRRCAVGLALLLLVASLRLLGYQVFRYISKRKRPQFKQKTTEILKKQKHADSEQFIRSEWKNAGELDL